MNEQAFEMVTAIKINHIEMRLRGAVTNMLPGKGANVSFAWPRKVSKDGAHRSIQ